MSSHVCQMTTVHNRKDGRIFHKECISLVEKGYKVTLLVNDGLGKENDHEVQLLDIGGHKGRIKRIVIAQPKMLFLAWKQNADIYHYHDPELLGVGLVLSLMGKHVIYDVHEDLPNDVLAKPWIPPKLRKPVSRIVAALERFAARRLAACICTTPTIQQRFEKTVGSDTVLLRNYPVTRAIMSGEQCDRTDKDLTLRFCYAGTIADPRGLRQMIDLAGQTQIRLCLMGPIRGVALDELESMPGWAWVDYLGVLTKEEVELEYRRQPAIGLVILLPGYGYDEALPIKLFEYMLFGLPVVCSDFPLWQSIVGDDDCGVAVDPEDIGAISKVVMALKSDPKRMREMAARGEHAVLSKYSWVSEREKLYSLYARLLCIPKSRSTITDS